MSDESKCPHGYVAWGCHICEPLHVAQAKERFAASTREALLQFFAYEHLPEKLRDVSHPFADLALEIVSKLPRNPERTVALRKLLEAKDAAVRAAIAKDTP